MHRKSRRRQPLYFLLDPVEPRRLFAAALAAEGEDPPPPAAQPDLAVSAPQLYPPGTHLALAAGDAATVAFTISNVGQADAPSSFTGRVFLSRDAILSDDDLPLTSFQSANLPATSSVPLAARVTLPDSTTDQTWYPIAAIDPATVPADDADAANNVAVGAPVRLPAKRFTLLTATPPTGPILPGESFTITATALVTGLHPDDPNFLSASIRRPNLTIDLQPDLAPVVLPIGTDGSTNPMLVLISATFTLPEGTPPGPFSLDLTPILFKGAAAVDPTYAPPTLNVAALTPFISLATPTPSVTSVEAGSSFSLSVTAQNSGGTPTAPSTLRYFLSPSRTLDPATAQILGTSFLAPLAPGDTRTLTPSFAPSLPAGRYYLIVTLDSPHDGAFADTATTSSPPLPVTITVETLPGPEPEPEPEPLPNPGPIPTDFSLANLSAPPVATGGSSLRITASPSVTGPLVRYYLSTTPSGGAGSIELGTFQASTVTSIKVPAWVTPATYYLVATIDPDNAIPESSEANNTAVTTVTLVRPDLKGSVTAAPTKVVADTPYNLKLTLKNPGQQTVGRKYRVIYYVSDDQALSDDDTRVPGKQVIVISVAPKRTQTFNLTYKLRKDTPLGTRYLIAALDTPGAANPAARLELATKPLKVTAPNVTAQVRSVKRQGTATHVTLRLTNSGTAPQTAPLTLELSTPSKKKPLLSTRQPVKLPPRKSIQVTITLPKAPKNLDPSTLSATIL